MLGALALSRFIDLDFSVYLLYIFCFKKTSEWKITIIIHSLGVLSRRKMAIFYFIWLCSGCFLENQSKCRTDLGAGRKPFVDGRVLREAFPFHACATCAFYTAIKK